MLGPCGVQEAVKTIIYNCIRMILRDAWIPSILDYAVLCYVYKEVYEMRTNIVLDEDIQTDYNKIEFLILPEW